MVASIGKYLIIGGQLIEVIGMAIIPMESFRSRKEG